MAGRHRIFGLVVAAALCAGLCAGLGACASLPEPSGVRSYYSQIDTPAGPVGVYVREQGYGPAMLLLHGFGASTYTWRDVQPALARHYRTIAIDFKGFGRSDKPFDRRYSLFDQADLVERFIEKHKLSNLTLVGHSYGGGVALALAVNYARSGSSRISRLILMDPLAYRQDLPLALKVLQVPVLSHLGITVIPPEINTRAALNYAYYDDSKVTWEAVREYAWPLYSIDGKFAAIRAAEQIVPPQIDSYTKRYPSIAVPTLIVWCRHDKIVPVVNGWRLKRAIAGSRLTIIKECGHAPQEETPAQTLRAMRVFLAD